MSDKDPEGSSPDEPCRCGHALRFHHWDQRHGPTDPVYKLQCVICLSLDDAPMAFQHDFRPAAGETAGEPEAPEEQCRCGHPRAGHSVGPCLGEVLVAKGTDRENCRCRAFVPAGPDGPEPRCEGCGHTDGEGCGCPPPGLYGEPEAPERIERVDPDCALPGGCTDKLKRPCRYGCRFAAQLRGEGLMPREPGPEPPRRPPYAVAYEIEGGGLFEIALPGDATVRMDDGVLIVMHTQGAVKALVQARPMEGQ